MSHDPTKAGSAGGQQRPAEGARRTRCRGLPAPRAHCAQWHPAAAPLRCTVPRGAALPRPKPGALPQRPLTYHAAPGPRQTGPRGTRHGPRPGAAHSRWERGVERGGARHAKSPTPFVSFRAGGGEVTHGGMYK